MRFTLCLILIVLGFIAGMRFAGETIGKRVCQSKGYTNHEILADWTIRCLTIIPMQEPK